MPDLIEAVYRSMEYCIGRKKIINVDKILITGGTSDVVGIEAFMAEALGVVSEKWNPLDHVGAGEGSKKEFGGALSVAMGLAIREWQRS
jgi:Tfp pilus assembly PilM family ATPase